MILSVRDSNPIKEPLKAFEIKTFSGFCPNTVQKHFATYYTAKVKQLQSCFPFFTYAQPSSTTENMFNNKSMPLKAHLPTLSP